MKGCKRWATTAAATCCLCRQEYPASTAGVMCDFSAAVENTTIVKFICEACAGPIATAMVGADVLRRSEEQRRSQELLTEQMFQSSRGRR